MTVEINIVTDTYYKGIEIASDIRKLLEVPKATYSNMTIEDA